MKDKINPAVILLTLTGILLIAGIFLIGIRTGQQIHTTEQSLDSFISQVNTLKEGLDDATTSYSDAIKQKSDLLNYQTQKASGTQPTVQEHREDSDSSQSDTPSVFSENTSPEYDSSASDTYDTEDFSDDSIWSN